MLDNSLKICEKTTANGVLIHARPPNRNGSRKDHVMAERQISAQAEKYQCKSCERVKSANDFYVSNQSNCKECVKERAKMHRDSNADYYRAYDRKRYRDSEHRKANAQKSAASMAGVASRAASTARTRADQPQKYQARNAVSNALRDGKIARGTECYFCASSNKLHAHHEDYSHPLDVVWLCPQCHGKLHTIKGDFRRVKP